MEIERSSSYTSTETTEDPMETFFFDNTDFIIDMYDDFKERFSHNPEFFSCLQSTDLTDLFVECLFKDTTQHFIMNDVLSVFYDEFSDEINISYEIVYRFLKCHKHKLDWVRWIDFCYRFT